MNAPRNPRPSAAVTAPAGAPASVPGSARLRSHAERAAIDWEVRLRDADVTEQELHAFTAWHDGAAEHAAAWASLQARLGALGGRGAPGAAAVAHALRQPALERRRALRTGFRAGFGAALLAVTGTGSWQLAHQLGFDATWRSCTGVRGAAVLADGSALTFDAGSRIDHVARAGALGLGLRQGQLLVRARGAVAVSLAGAAVECGGGELCVGRLGRRGIVAVRGGSARVHLGGAAPVTLASGQTLTFGAAGAHSGANAATGSALSFSAASAWTRGMLVADRLPLADLFDAFGRYHTDLVRATGGAAARVISGVFRLDDLEAALKQVAAALPVRVRRYGFLTIVE